MASRGVNKVTIVGSLGADPEIRYMPNGNAVCNLSVATSESWKDQKGNLKEETEWHKIVIYRGLAEVACEYLRKGSQAYFEGKLKTRKWQDNNGNDRYTTEIIVTEMQMLDRKSDSNGTPNQSQQPQSGNKQQSAEPIQAPQRGSQQGYDSNVNHEEDRSDTPF